MRKSESDAELVLAAQAGDKEAFAVLVSRHRPLLLALCRRALADPILAEDAAQEAMLTAMLNVDRLRRTDRFGPWLGGIGLNICRRMVRERSRDGWSWEAVHGGRRERELPDPEPGPEAQAEATDLAGRTRDAIAILPPGQRAAVVLFYLSDLTHAETAVLLGISEGAVKTRLHKARTTLKRQLSTVEREDIMDERLSRRTLTKTAAALSGSAVLTHDATVRAGANEVKNMPDARGTTGLVEMRVADVRRNYAESGKPRACVVMLEEIDRPRRLPIWIGEPEGIAIAIQLEAVQMPRPLAVAFTANLLHAAGGKLREVHIDRLIDNVFYATAVVERNEEISTVDARPSDAINLALLIGAPIRVNSAIIDAAILENEGSAADIPIERTEGPSEIVADLMASWTTPSSTSAV